MWNQALYAIIQKHGNLSTDDAKDSVAKAERVGSAISGDGY